MTDEIITNMIPVKVRRGTPLRLMDLPCKLTVSGINSEGYLILTGAIDEYPYLSWLEKGEWENVSGAGSLIPGTIVEGWIYPDQKPLYQSSKPHARS